MRRSVVVTGAAALTPLGSLDETWCALLAGRSRVEAVRLAGNGHAVPGARSDLELDAVPDARLRRPLGRAGMLAVAAALAAWRDAGLAGANADAAGAVLASPAPDLQLDLLHPAFLAARQNGHFDTGGFARELRRTVPPHWRLGQVPNVIGHALAALLKIRGPQLTVASACASGADAIGLAARMIEEGRVEIALAGGADNLLFAPAHALLRRFDLLSADHGPAQPFDRRRRGLVPGEGAAVLVLESAESAAARGAAVLGRFLGYGAATVPPAAADAQAGAEGFARAMSAALRDAALAAEDVGGLFAYAPGTLTGDREESLAIRQLFGTAVRVTSTKGGVGYLGAASGAVDAALALRALQGRVIPPVANLTEPDELCPVACVAGEAAAHPRAAALCNTHGLGGQYASLVLGRAA